MTIYRKATIRPKTRRQHREQPIPEPEPKPLPQDQKDLKHLEDLLKAATEKTQTTQHQATIRNNVEEQIKALTKGRTCPLCGINLVESNSIELQATYNRYTEYYCLEHGELTLRTRQDRERKYYQFW